MKKFDYIEHTADIGLVAYGRNLPEAYGNAAYGLFSIITDLRKVKQIESQVVELQENDPESLLFEWLNHLIYLFEVDRMLFKKCTVQEYNGRHLKAVCTGEHIDPKRHELKLGVKAATYHMLTVDPAKNRVQVIFDV
jgi:SHS2 domain-containing protein